MPADDGIRGLQFVNEIRGGNIPKEYIPSVEKGLKEATEQEILEGIEKSLAEISTAGTSCFCDFREGGLLGVYQLRKAMKHCRIHSVILSRPTQMTYKKEELDHLLENSDGIGLSSISDWEPSEIEKLAAHVRKKKKLFALHASEVVPGGRCRSIPRS